MRNFADMNINQVLTRN